MFNEFKPFKTLNGLNLERIKDYEIEDRAGGYGGYQVRDGRHCVAKKGLGYIDPAGWNRVARDLSKAGFYPTPPNAKAAYTTKFKSRVTP